MIDGTRYHLAISGRQLAGLTAADVRAHLAADPQGGHEARVWTDGWSDWRPAREIISPASEGQPPPLTPVLQSAPVSQSKILRQLTIVGLAVVTVALLVGAMTGRVLGSVAVLWLLSLLTAVAVALWAAKRTPPRGSPAWEARLPKLAFGLAVTLLVIPAVVLPALDVPEPCDEPAELRRMAALESACDRLVELGDSSCIGDIVLAEDSYRQRCCDPLQRLKNGDPRGLFGTSRRCD